MNAYQRGWRVFIEFADREYTDQWATIEEVNPWGITVKLEKPVDQVWFYPWTSILGIRLDNSPARSA